MRTFRCIPLLALVAGCQTVSEQPLITKTVPLKDFSALQANVVSARTKSLDISAATNELNAAQEAEIQHLLSDAYQACGSVMGGLANKSESGEREAFWLQMSGLILGSVIAPAATAANAMAHRALISAASGWAGATNLAGQSLRASGMAGDTAATVRNEIASAFKTDIQTALDGKKSFEDRRNSVLAARGECFYYAVNVPGAMPAIPAAGGAAPPGK